MDYYSILGVPRTATDEEIKLAFRKLAKTHHPDLGGDESKFKEINEAYAVLSDPGKKQEYDMRGRAFKNSFSQSYDFDFGFDPFGGAPSDFQDLFKNFGFTFRTSNIPRKNKDLQIKHRISLADSYTGKHVNIKYKVLSGEEKSIDFYIPEGVENGQILKVNGYGDDSNPALSPGDLTVIIEIEKETNFKRDGINLITSIDIDIFEAMLGCTKTIKNIDGSNIELSIKPGAQHGQKYSCNNLGFKHIKFNNVRGDLIVELIIKTPVIKDARLIDMVNYLAKEVRKNTVDRLV